MMVAGLWLLLDPGLFSILYKCSAFTVQPPRAPRGHARGPPHGAACACAAWAREES